MALPIETARLEALRKLSRERYGEISPAEDEVLQRSVSFEEEPPSTAKAKTRVSAAFLRWVATDKDAVSHIDPLGLRVKNATVSGPLNLEFSEIPFPLEFDGCTFHGTVDLVGAKLPALYLFDCILNADMECSMLTTAGHLSFQNLRSSEAIDLNDARIGGDLIFLGAKLSGTLSLERATVAGNVVLGKKFSSSSEIRLIGAQIGGVLDCMGGAMLSSKDKALSADGASITGTVFLKDGFSSSGEVRFVGAQIGGDLDCRGATLNGTGKTLFADRVRITEDVFLTEGFSSSGEIRFPGAQIGGNVACDGAKLSGLNADRAKITGNVFLRNGFSALGEIKLVGAQIGGDLDCSAAMKVGKLNLETSRLGGDLLLFGVTDASQTSLTLTECTMTTLHDEPRVWPAKGNLHLADFVYKSLDLHAGPGHPSAARDRVEWLMLQPDEEVTNAQPWMQLANVLESNGDPSGAKLVRYEYRRLQAHAGGAVPSIASFPVDLLERNPLWIGWFIGGFWAVGSLAFWRAQRMRAMAPTDKDAYRAFANNEPLPGNYQPFNPFIYTLENVLPVVKLGQDSAWAPDHRPQTGTWLPEQPACLRSFANRWKLTRWLIRWDSQKLAALRVALILAGWAMALILAAAIGARFKESP